MDLAYHDDGTCMPEEILSSDLGCNLTDGGINLQCVLSLEQSILTFQIAGRAVLISTLSVITLWKYQYLMSENFCIMCRDKLTFGPRSLVLHFSLSFTESKFQYDLPREAYMV